jgi:hypothetical protein
MTRPYPQLSPFVAARGEAGISTSVPVVGLGFKGAVVRLTADETLVTSTAIPWDAQVSDKGNWWSANSATLFVTPANVRQAQFQMGAYLTPGVADMQFYMLKNGAPFPGGGYSQTASGNVGFTWTSAPVDTVEGDLWEMIPEFAAGAPVLDADEVGGTWLAIEAKSAIAPSTAPRGANVSLTGVFSVANSTNTTVVWEVASRDTDSFWSVDSLGLVVIGGGVEHVDVLAQAQWTSAGGSIRQHTILYNGVNIATARTNEDGIYGQVDAGRVLVSSGDTFALQVHQDAGGSNNLVAAGTWLKLEVADPAYLANVDSYHGMFFSGVPTSLQETHRIKAPFAFTIPASLEGSTGSVGTAPNSVETWSFQKDDVEFAQATITLSGDVTFASSLEQEFGPDTNVLTFVAPLTLGIAEQISVAYSAWGQSSTINLPVTGVKSGDILVAMLGVDSDAYLQFSYNQYDSAAGWQLRGSRVPANGSGAVLTKVCDGTETSPTSMGISGSAQSWSYTTYRIEGADPNPVPHKFSLNGYDSNSTWFGAPTITPTIDGCLLLTHVVGGWGSFNFSTPSPYTEQYDQTNGGSTGAWISMAGASYIQPTAGAIQPIHYCSASIWRSCLAHIAFKPAGT